MQFKECRSEGVGTYPYPLPKGRELLLDMQLSFLRILGFKGFSSPSSSPDLCVAFVMLPPSLMVPAKGYLYMWLFLQNKFYTACARTMRYMKFYPIYITVVSLVYFKK